MNNPEITRTEQREHASTGFNKRVILSMGGKGGVGKTSIMAGLAEWFDANRIPVQLLDQSSEPKEDIDLIRVPVRPLPPVRRNP